MSGLCWTKSKQVECCHFLNWKWIANLTTPNSTVLVERLIKDYFKAHCFFNQKRLSGVLQPLKAKWQKLEIKISHWRKYLKEVEALGIATNYFKRVIIQLNGFNQRQKHNRTFWDKSVQEHFCCQPMQNEYSGIICLWLAINDQGLPQVWD